MSAHGRLWAAALALSTCAPIACLQQADPIAAEQLEIDCRGTPCHWTMVGKALADPPTTWEDGDVGLDLSGTGLVEAKLDVVLLQQTSRVLDLRAAIVRPDDPTVTLRFELEWFAPGQGFGSTFWERAPVSLAIETFDVWESGAAAFRRTALVPSEAAAVELRIVKDSKQAAQVMVGDVTLGHPAGSTL